MQGKRAVLQWCLIAVSAVAALWWLSRWIERAPTARVPLSLAAVAAALLLLVACALLRRSLRAERGVAASERRFRDLLYDLDAIVWDADPATLRFQFVSERARDILGYPAEQWLREPDFLARHLHPDDRERALEFCRQAAKTGGYHDLEYRMLAADGRVVWIRGKVRVVLDESGARQMRGLMLDITEAKEAQQARQKSEATNRALLGAIPDLMLRIGRDGTYRDYRTAKGVPLFTDPAGLVGKTVAEALPAEIAAETAVLMERAFRTGETQLHECRLPVDGAPHDFEARLMPVSEDEALVLVRDITGRKRAEEALRAAEAELRRVLSSVSDCIWTAEAGADGRIRFLYHSPVVEKISGHAPEYYAGLEQWLEQVHAEDRQRLESSFRRMAAGQTVREQEEYRLLWPDGTARWVRTSVSASRLRDGWIRLDGVDSDITVHKLADEALRQASQALETVIQASPLAIFAFDLEGSVKTWNPAAERMFGWLRDEVLHRRLPLVEDHDLEAFHDRVERGKRGRMMNGLEVKQRRKDGSSVEISLWTAPLRDASGTLNGFIAMAADITERRLLEEQLRQSQKMEAVGRLAGGVAHDFNNLLTVITGHGHLLLNDLGPEGPLRASVDEILRAVERASALTNQLLAFSRRQVIQPKVLDLTALVANMDRMLRRVIGEDIELVNVLSPELGQVKVDAGQMEQVVMNLVVNSRDATQAGGRITIRTANVELGRQYARVYLTAQPGSYVMLSVSDTGHGMDPETKAHLFEPFYTTKDHGKGTGIGLSTVYGIIKHYGGHISVASEPGQGTTIAIYLPRTEEGVPEERHPPASAGRKHGTETILLVEDEGDVRKLVYEVLSQHGYAVLQACQPEAAIELCQEYKGMIDLLLTDVVMPQMGGRELAERLAWARPDMKVLFMSGYTEDAPLHDTAETPFLKKPFTPVALAHKVRQTLDATNR